MSALFAKSACVGRGVHVRRESVEELERRLIGQDDDVELLLQLACAHDGVHERDIGDLPGIEHPAGPTLIHRSGVRAI
jgi:hypothetical protein